MCGLTRPLSWLDGNSHVLRSKTLLWTHQFMEQICRRSSTLMGLHHLWSFFTLEVTSPCWKNPRRVDLHVLRKPLTLHISHMALDADWQRDGPFKEKYTHKLWERFILEGTHPPLEECNVPFRIGALERRAQQSKEPRQTIVGVIQR